MKNFLRIFTLVSFSFITSHAIGERRPNIANVNIPVSAFSIASGGINVSQKNNFTSSFWNNSAFLKNDLAGTASLDYGWGGASSSITVLSTVFKEKNTGLWGLGMKYSSIPSIQGYDEVGGATNTFSARDYVINIAKSHKMGNFRIGTNLKYASSSIDTYTSSALLLDVGGLFIHPKKDLTIGLNVKNLGFLISDYTETSDTALGLDIELGLSFKPEHMPIRFTITGYGLVPSSSLYSDEKLEIKEAQAIEEIFSHVLLSGNILLSKNFHVQLAYNYRIHRELQVGEGMDVSGLSYGFFLKLKSLSFAYSHAFYHKSSGINSLSLQLDFNKMLKKGKK